jgi:3-hydroxy-9,10-secoandrosta-1,3,5(10)-triene-9,17-dione monooxygenase reductase component
MMGNAMSNAFAFDVGGFRKALSGFATGVTVMTARGDDGRLVGVTCNSFNSVSLTPPLILWSLAKKSSSVPVFLNSRYFAVNILSHDQEHLSRQFATSSADKFAGVDFEAGHGGVPILQGATTLECEMGSCYDEGDHYILVGKVVRYDRNGKPPLIFHDGQYLRLQAEPPSTH